MDNTIGKNIGKNVKKLRSASNMSSQQLATIIGITRSQVSKIETNSSNPSIDILIKIANVFNCTVSEIIGETPFNIPPEIKLLIEATNNVLSTDQIELLTHFIKSIKKDN